MAWENATELLPEPSAEPPAMGARVPKLSLQVPGLAVEKRNQPVVASPPGIADPFSWPVVPVSTVALLVVTAGSAAGVVKERTAPKPNPKAFEAMAQK
jgi:hypothetical protein